MSRGPIKIEAAISALQQLLEDRLSTSSSVREHHGKDESWHAPKPPDAVCFPSSTQEVSQIVRICSDHFVPVIPFGGGTSLEGHIIAIHGGVSVDLSQMTKILSVNAEDLDATIEPGVTRQTLNHHLRDQGLFFPIDPGADATLGGMVATRASGTNAVRYGTMRENVLSLTVVLPDGKVIRTSRRARKSAAGYDLTRLFVGSEGTLGIITEVTIRLYGIPEAMSAAVVGFPDIASAVDAVILTIQSGIPVARIELLDEIQMDAVNRYSKLDYEVRPTLFLEFHGNEKSVEAQAIEFGEIADDHGGSAFRWATDTAERERLWKARHDAYYASLALRPGCKGLTTDVCVPISRLTECITETKKDIEQSSLTAPLVGHVGDGNFHLVILIDPERPHELEEAERLNIRLVQRALAMDGTCTGEHGVGFGKRQFLEAEHGTAIDTMRLVKKALDPRNIMNPGKIVDTAE